MAKVKIVSFRYKFQNQNHSMYNVLPLPAADNRQISQNIATKRHHKQQALIHSDAVFGGTSTYWHGNFPYLHSGILTSTTLIEQNQIKGYRP